MSLPDDDSLSLLYVNPPISKPVTRREAAELLSSGAVEINTVDTILVAYRLNDGRVLSFVADHPSEYVWKSRGRLFESEDEYQAHMASIFSANKASREPRRHLLSGLRLTPHSFPDIQTAWRDLLLFFSAGLIGDPTDAKNLRRFDVTSRGRAGYVPRYVVLNYIALASNLVAIHTGGEVEFYPLGRGSDIWEPHIVTAQGSSIEVFRQICESFLQGKIPRLEPMVASAVISLRRNNLTID